jgi:hypothetical protein
MHYLTSFSLFILNIIIVMSQTIKATGGNMIVCPSGKYNVYLEDLVNRDGRSTRRRRRRFTLTCVDCGAGRFMDAAEHVFFACKACPSGQYQPDEGMASCLGTMCPSGKFGSIAQITMSNTPCTDCAVGKYTSASGLGNECVSCESGRHQANTGGTNCQGALCIAGKFGPEMTTHRSKATCSDCSVGTFSEKAGETKCLPCSSGQYQTLEGQTRCMSKPTCKGMSEFFNKGVFACTLTNDNFEWLIPMGIAFTVAQALFGCYSGYCIVFLNFLVSLSLTVHYGLGDYTGAHSDKAVWGIFSYYVISMLWTWGMLWKSTKKRYPGDDAHCFPWSKV